MGCMQSYYGIANENAKPQYRGKLVRVDFGTAACRRDCERLGLRDRHDVVCGRIERWHKAPWNELPHEDVQDGFLGDGITDFRLFSLPYEQADWMSRLKDEILLTSVALPGSHDSGSEQPEFGMLGFVRTQEYSVLLQLLLGVRVFDIRPTRAGDSGKYRNDGTIWTFHGESRILGGGVKCENLGRMLNCIDMFLQQYPSETVVFVVSHYVNVDQQAVTSELANYLGSKLLNPPSRAAKEALTVRQVRGKLLLLTEEDAERNLGPNEHKGTNDWSEMRAHLDAIPQRRNVYNRFVVALTPQGVADLNPQQLTLQRGLPGLSDWLLSPASDKIGIVEADYFGTCEQVLDMVGLILKKNLRLGNFRDPQ